MRQFQSKLKIKNSKRVSNKPSKSGIKKNCDDNEVCVDSEKSYSEDDENYEANSISDQCEDSGSNIDDSDDDVTNGYKDGNGSVTEDEGDLTEKKHKKALNKLEKTDPEFFNYLKKNDRKLLEFGESDSDLDEEHSEQIGNVHEPPASLEVASDESDFEDNTDSSGTTKITLNLVEKWEKDLQVNRKSTQPVSIAIRAFHAALLRVIGDSEQKECIYKVDGSSVFNAVVQLCVISLYPYIQKMLNLPLKSVSSNHVMKSKNWPRLKSLIRGYILDLFKLIGNVASPEILSVLLKHAHQLMPFVSSLPTILKPVLKRLMTLWSTSADDTVRVLAFLCILRLTTLNHSLHHTVLKMMYASYIANSKFLSPYTIPGINFMRQSLTQMFVINEDISYNHAFLYIRQLAIHLRSAVMLKKKESMQAVYTWQYISSLRLWVDILCATQDKPQLQSLLYPTTQIITGCIKLIPTAQYLPLRIHCIQMLNKLSRETGVFIPVLPFLLEIITLVNVNSQHTKLSMKPMDFTCVLRLSKSDMQENAFKDAVIEYFHQYTLEYVADESYRISFPDTVVPVLLQIKHFLKECKNTNYSRKLKSLVEKVEETCKVINTERMKCGIALMDQKGIAAWESNMKLKGTPLSIFYESWLKVHQQQMARKHTDTVTVSEFNLPTLKKREPKSGTSKPLISGNKLFESDDDEEDGDEISFKINSENKDKTGSPAVNPRKRKNVDKKSEKKIKTRKVNKNKTLNSNDSNKNGDITDNIPDQNDIIKDFDMTEFML